VESGWQEKVWVMEHSTLNDKKLNRKTDFASPVYRAKQSVSGLQRIR